MTTKKGEGLEHPQAAPQCWSYAPEGQRCAKPAGHDDEHEHVAYTRWTDEEAWTPEKAVLGPEAVAVLDGLRGPEEPATDDDEAFGPVERAPVCFNCEHPLHVGACQVKVGAHRADCGCTFAG